MQNFDPVSSVDMIAAALRADVADTSVLATVLCTKLQQLLPPKRVTANYTRTLADRVAKRDGHLSSVKVSLDNAAMELSQDQMGQITCSVNQIVRGIVISRKEMSLGEWIVILAQELAQAASTSAQTRDALLNLLN